MQASNSFYSTKYPDGLHRDPDDIFRNRNYRAGTKRTSYSIDERCQCNSWRGNYWRNNSNGQS